MYKKNPVEYTGNIRVEHPEPVEENPSPFEVIGWLVVDTNEESV